MLAHHRVAQSKARGFAYYSAPEWRLQGLQKYDAVIHSTEANRTTTYAR